VIVLPNPSAPGLDRGGLDVLDWDECLSLVGTQPIGRLGVTQDALPIIMPVAYSLLDRTPVFKVGSGTVRRAATQGAVCCFEVDSASVDWSTAWSVMMIGRLAVIGDPPTIARASALGLPSWPGHAETETAFVRLVPQLVTGRSLGARAGQ
jgi:nitroimidazol reductase NimA-like FMN-containing flavoprotein (pyridoxamine 5'-phosphate oxidase superfamily)